MNQKLTFFARIQGEVRGPLTLAQLKDLAEGEVISPQSEIASERAGPWSALQDLPGAAEVLPVRRNLQFVKSPRFEQLNERGGKPLDHREMIAAANRPVGPAADAQPPVIKTPAANDVLQIVQAVARVEKTFEKPIVVKKKRPKPPLLYIVLLLVGNAAIFSLHFFYRRPLDPITLGWMAIYTAVVMVLAALRNRNL